jgi:hypothetical protein
VTAIDTPAMSVGDRVRPTATRGSATLKVPSPRFDSPDETASRQKDVMDGESHTDGENSIGGPM